MRRDQKLVDLIVEAQTARSLLMAAPDTSIDQLATGQGRCRPHVAKLVKLSCLAPEIVIMVLEGRQPTSLTRRRLMMMELPMRWAEQRAVLGCGQDSAQARPVTATSGSLDRPSTSMSTRTSLNPARSR